MIFYLESKPWYVGHTKREHPYIELLSDNWDDFGYETYFTAFYFFENRKIELGPVKILHKEKLITKKQLQPSFESLSKEFCSLGQSMDYYRKLSELPREVYIDIFDSLRDITYNKDIGEDFSHIKGYNDSLFRSSEASKAYKTAYEKFFLNADIEDELFQFDFSYRAPYSELENSISFDFEQHNFLPNRINILVGKNGTGKTQLISKFADALCGKSGKPENLFNPPKIPLFSKVIAVSFSAFDNFRKPYNEKSNDLDDFSDSAIELSNYRKMNNYVYCGIQDGKGKTFSLKELKDNGKKNLAKIQDRDLFLDEDESFINKWREVLLNTEIPSRYLDNPEDVFDNELSSGQSILVSVITEIIANIEEESILLIDEPELHLHPNAVSNLVRMLYRLLEEFNSYSIICTHSPLLVQEIPSMYITKLERTEDDLLFINKLPIETFGENVSTIINEVFNVREVESNYKTILKKAVFEDSLDADEIIELFPQELSLHAMTYLNILINQRNREL
ncbi:AAA family ATPase [Rossellomorea vietnamensis]|uniref:AAA family ATPase n=1 Tax=Rossellomorea vietnamensis TaxID=218284 RepID=UPI003CE748F8